MVTSRRRLTGAYLMITAMLGFAGLIVGAWQLAVSHQPQTIASGAMVLLLVVFATKRHRLWLAKQ